MSVNSFAILLSPVSESNSPNHNFDTWICIPHVLLSEVYPSSFAFVYISNQGSFST